MNQILNLNTQKSRRRNGRLARPAVAGGVLLLLLSMVIALPGCDNLAGPDDVANQSLVEIGEYSLEHAEALERDGRLDEANIAYRRSLWAFKYHQKLTNDEPLLLDEALEGARRTTRRGP